MLSKYRIEYGIPLGARIDPQWYETDDPVACEQFLVELLECGFKIKAITHCGIMLSPVEFNHMIKTAANMLAADYICTSLDMNTEQERHQFGFVA